ncbi:MAG: hypothetical protein ACREFI_01115 [Stellaceae bacterium]
MSSSRMIGIPEPSPEFRAKVEALLAEAEDGARELLGLGPRFRMAQSMVEIAPGDDRLIPEVPRQGYCHEYVKLGPKWSGIVLCTRRASVGDYCAQHAREHGLIPIPPPPYLNGDLWPPGRIIAAFWKHAAANDGEPPCSYEWNLTTDEHPSFNRVHKTFGSWNNGMLAAGFEPRNPMGGRAAVDISAG